MNETDMKAYIARTKMPFPLRQYYEMGAAELVTFLDMGLTSDMIFLAFLFGRAKGYRMAKAEGRR